MVVTFIGFAASWVKALFSPDQLFLAGTTGAFIITYFMFLPSLLLILAGGPLVESTHGNLKFTAPLTGITAAVVGMIQNLAAFFSHHVFWPHGFSGHFDTLAVLTGLTALLALLRYKVGLIPIIAACGALGFLVTLIKPWLIQVGVLL